MIGGALDEYALKVLSGEGKWGHYFKIEPEGNYLSRGPFGSNAGCLTQWVYWLSGPANGGVELKDIKVIENLTFPLMLKENHEPRFS